MINMDLGFFKHIKKIRNESSFTLLETVIALGLMVTIILEVANVQGTSITFGENNRNISQASWLANAVLSKVEWYSKFYEFKELDYEGKDLKFNEDLCPMDPKYGACEFKYNLKIEEFPLPIVSLFSQQISGGDDTSGVSDQLEKQIKEFLGDEIIKIAHVEVFWPEGSRRGSVEMSYLITNQKKLDEEIFKQKALLKAGKPKPDPKPDPN